MDNDSYCENLLSDIHKYSTITKNMYASIADRSLVN